MFLVALTAAQHASAVAVYTDRNAWEASIGGGSVITDTFSTPIPFSQSIAFDSGVASTGIGVDTVLLDSNTADAGAYSGRVDTFNRLSNTYDSITWTFPASIFAFGADWDGVLTGGKLTLTGNFDGFIPTTMNFADFPAFTGTGFFGVIGSAPFSSISFGTQTDVRDEIFFVDNLVFAPVPEPATWALLGLGFVAFALARRHMRRRRRCA